MYNKILPDDGQLGATLLVEITDEVQIATTLDRLVGLQEHVWLVVGGERIKAEFDPDQFKADQARGRAVLEVHVVAERAEGAGDGGDGGGAGDRSPELPARGAARRGVARVARARPRVAARARFRITRTISYRAHDVVSLIALVLPGRRHAAQDLEHQPAQPPAVRLGLRGEVQADVEAAPRAPSSTAPSPSRARSALRCRRARPRPRRRRPPRTAGARECRLRRDRRWCRRASCRRACSLTGRSPGTRIDARRSSTGVSFDRRRISRASMLRRRIAFSRSGGPDACSYCASSCTSSENDSSSTRPITHLRRRIPVFDLIAVRRRRRRGCTRR